MTTFPWAEDGGPSVYELAKEQREYDPSKFGIARRAILDEPIEIVRFAYLGVRTCLRTYSRSPRQEGYALWHNCLWALAINDYPSIEYMANRVDFPADGKHGAYPEYYATISDLFFGLLTSNHEYVKHARERLKPSRLPTNDAALSNVLVAVAERSPEGFARSLEDELKSKRKIRYIDPHYKFVDVMAHGLWALGHRVDMQVVDNWDIGRVLPWDAGFHEWHVKGHAAQTCIDETRLSDESRDLLAIPTPAQDHG